VTETRFDGKRVVMRGKKAALLTAAENTGYVEVPLIQNLAAGVFRQGSHWYRLHHGCYRCAQLRIRCQYPKVAMPVHASWRHQCGDADYQLQRCEYQISALATHLWFGAVVYQVSAALAQSIHGKGWARATTQQALQPSTVGGGDAHTGIHREAAVLVSQLLSGVKALDQAPPC